MAEKRMFAKQIIDSDAFLEMPLSSQALYFHLVMRADDDGFLNNAKKIMRIIGANQNDYDLLVAKRFLIHFPDSICVIKHWKIHNYIAKDRYKPTVFGEHLKQLIIKENRSYTECIQNDNSLYTMYTQIRLDKNSIDNINNKVKSKDVDPVLDDEELEHLTSSKKENNKTKTFETEFEEVWKTYPRKQGKKDALRHYITARKKGALQTDIVIGLERYNQYIKNNNISQQYIKQGKTWFCERSWEDDYNVVFKSDKKNVKETPEWVDKYAEEHKNIQSKELSKEEEKKVLEEAQKMFKTKQPERMKNNG